MGMHVHGCIHARCVYAGMLLCGLLDMFNFKRRLCVTYDMLKNLMLLSRLVCISFCMFVYLSLITLRPQCKVERMYFII